MVNRSNRRYKLILTCYIIYEIIHYICLRLIDSTDMSTLMLLVQSKSTSLSQFDSMPISSSSGLYLHPLIQNLKKEFKIMKKIQNFENFWKMRIQTFLNRVIFVIGILSFVAGMVILLYSVPKKYQLIPVGVLLAAFSVYACIYLVNDLI